MKRGGLANCAVRRPQSCSTGARRGWMQGNSKRRSTELRQRGRIYTKLWLCAFIAARNETQSLYHWLSLINKVCTDLAPSHSQAKSKTQQSTGHPLCRMNKHIMQALIFAYKNKSTRWSKISQYCMNITLYILKCKKQRDMMQNICYLLMLLYVDIQEAQFWKSVL